MKYKKINNNEEFQTSYKFGRLLRN